MGLYDLLGRHNTVLWHWKAEDPGTARKAAMNAQIYLTSANGLAETGEILNIDGAGNRVARHAVRPREGILRHRPQQAGSHL